MVEMDLNEALSIIGFGRAQIWVFLCCSLLILLHTNETLGVSILVVVTHCDLDTSTQHKSLLTSSLLAGMFLGAFYVGYQSDISGRARMLKMTLIGVCIASFVSAWMPHIYLLILLRFITGLFLSAPGSLVGTYLLEFCAPRWRPIIMNLLSYNVGFSLIYCPLVAKYFLPLDLTVTITEEYALHTWRYLMWLYTLPGLLGLIALLFLPESPYYLISVKRNEEAVKVVDWICRQNQHKKLEELDIQLSETKRNSIEREENFIGQWWHASTRVLKPPYLRDFMLCAVLMFGMFLTSRGLYFWYPLLRNQDNSGNRLLCEVISRATYLNSRSFDESKNSSETESLPPCVDTIENYQDPILYGISYLVCFACATLFLQFMRRKYVMFMFMLFAAICGLLLNFLRNQWCILICFIGMMVLPGVMVAQVSSVLVDSMPTQLTGKAMCMCRSFSRIGGISGSFIVGSLLQVSCLLTMNIFVFCLMICVILTLFLPS